MEKYRRRRRDEAATPNLLVQLGAALAALWRVLFPPKSRFNQVQKLAEFAQIEQLLDSGDAIHATQAIIRADSFLDGVMRQVGGQGQSFSDRLRSLESKFGRNLYQSVWEAHKLRNQIAHEHREVAVGLARNHLQTYRRAASALGAF